VKSLIEAAAGLSEGAIANHAVMHRLKADRTLEVISLDLEAILNGTLPDVALKNEDAIYVASNRTIETEKTVTIRGEVQHPGVYDYADNETLEDLVLQAGGLTDAASLVRVDVSRRVNDPKATETSEMTAETFSFGLRDGFVISGEPGFILKPYDQVVVRRSPSYNNLQTVRVEGEVLYEGSYTLTRKGQRLSEIIKQSGGLTEHAFAQGAKLLRRMTTEEQEQAVSMLRAASRNSGKDSIDARKLLVSDNYSVGIELDKALANPGSDYDPVLRHGDRIVVPEYTNTVTVNGEVLYPNTITFKKGKNADYYIQQAGGYSSTGKKSKTFIVYANGTVAKADRSHKPEPGCQIVVPTKSTKKGMSLPEIMAIGTSTASIATMIATIANLLK
jgi:protein involved in polysaccharide export with SLBB domain